jgi:hypothetical protein
VPSTRGDALTVGWMAVRTPTTRGLVRNAGRGPRRDRVRPAVSSRSCASDRSAAVENLAARTVGMGRRDDAAAPAWPGTQGTRARRRLPRRRRLTARPMGGPAGADGHLPVLRPGRSRTPSSDRRRAGSSSRSRGSVLPRCVHPLRGRDLDTITATAGAVVRPVSAPGRTPPDRRTARSARCPRIHPLTATAGPSSPLNRGRAGRGRRPTRRGRFQPNPQKKDSMCSTE